MFVSFVGEGRGREVVDGGLAQQKKVSSCQIMIGVTLPTIPTRHYPHHQDQHCQVIVDIIAWVFQRGKCYQKPCLFVVSPCV